MEPSPDGRLVRQPLNDKTLTSTLHQFLLDPSSVPKEARYEIATFVVSFCGRPGRSGQWLHYGRAGRGVALGVSSLIAPAVGYDLIRVDYNLQSQSERMLRLLETGASTINAVASNLEIEKQVMIARVTAHVVSLHIRLLSAEMKHPSFSDEDEWRLMAHDVSYDGMSIIKGRPIDFRNAGDQIIPYEKLVFGDGHAGLIKEVIVGHASTLSEDAVRSDVPVR